ncbi:MAG: hypothetical protein P9L94_14955 [Candidatus Hinthialibacter antarcticus]|nr:hypothetical protein [Candidatus Hinthialibacter antarcticus]
MIEFSKQETRFITVFAVICVVYFFVSFVFDQFVELAYYDELQALFVPALLYPSFHFSRKVYFFSTALVMLTIGLTDFALMTDAVGAVRTAAIVLIGVLMAQEMIFRNARTQRILKDEKEEIAAKLEQTLDKVRRLSEILPMCGVCNQLRTDDETWSKFEGFLKDELHVELIHGVCENCLREMMDDISVEKGDSSTDLLFE